MMRLINFLASLGVQHLPSTWGTLFLMIIVVMLIKFVVDWFLQTEVGLAIRATGDNKKMIRSLSANTDTLIILGSWFIQWTCRIFRCFNRPVLEVCRYWNGNWDDYYWTCFRHYR